MFLEFWTVSAVYLELLILGLEKALAILVTTASWCKIGRCISLCLGRVKFWFELEIWLVIPAAGRHGSQESLVTTFTRTEIPVLGEAYITRLFLPQGWCC